MISDSSKTVAAPNVARSARRDPSPNAEPGAASAARAPQRQGVIEPLALSYELRDFERFPIAPTLRAVAPKAYKQCIEIQRKARAFSEEVLLGHVERWDQEIGRNHDVIPWPILRAAAPYRFTSMNVPGVLGGGNYGAVATSVFTEEISAADAGVFVLFGAHALAVAAIIASLDMRALSRISRELREAEDRGEPMLLALAHTEVGGGSDVEDVDRLKDARLGSRWTKVSGGYRLHARKVFISNGAIARYNLVTAYGDARNPVDTFMAFLVPPSAEGFSVGRLEHKLGQRLSSSAEIICDNVFVPDADAISLSDHGRGLDTVLSFTRGPVGAMATGIIRGTLERTLKYLSQKRVRGRWLFEEQHVQLALADMVASLQAGRGLYMDAALALDSWGMGAALRMMPRLPGALTGNRLYEAIFSKAMPIARARALYEKWVPGSDLQRIVAHSSIAKYMCSDMAVRSTMRAMEILGEDANDPQWGVEKQLRDVKLAQIFEGTNQVNRLHVARGVFKRGKTPSRRVEAKAMDERAKQTRRDLTQGALRVAWNVGRLELREKTLTRTLRLIASKRAPVFAHDWTFADLLEWAARRYGGRTFLEYSGLRLTFEEANQRANRVARQLRAAGVGPGSGVALMLSNHPRFLDAFFATQKLGAYAVPVNIELIGDGLQYILEHSESSAVICDHDSAAKISALRQGTPRIGKIWVNTAEAPPGYRLPAGMQSFDELEVAGSDDRQNLGVRSAPDAPGLLLYTSGTTGMPKAVVSMYGTQRVKGIGVFANLLYDRSDRLYTCLPLFHANALMLAVMPALWVGIPLYLAKRFSATRFWQEIAACGATQFNTIGGMIPILLKTPPSELDRAHKVRRVVSAACPKDAWEPFEQRFGVTLWEGYGAVDGAGVTIFNAGKAPIGSLGRPAKMMKWRLVKEDGSDAAPGEPGELCVHVGDMTEGRVPYWRNEQASNEKVVDGWLHTGDMMQKDAESFLYFVGRNTDSMRRRGENVSAYEVEKVVDAYPDVLESAAFGVPSPMGEQDIMISLVLVDDRELDTQAFCDFLKERLPRYAQPTYLDVVKELPKTGTHRVIKAELKTRGVTQGTINLATLRGG